MQLLNRRTGEGRSTTAVNASAAWASTVSSVAHGESFDACRASHDGTRYSETKSPETIVEQIWVCYGNQGSGVTVLLYEKAIELFRTQGRVGHGR